MRTFLAEYSHTGLCQRPRAIDCPGRLDKSIPDVAGRCTLWDARSVSMPVPQLASALGAACAWPPTGAQQARKPAGGFIDCPVEYLTLPWWLYQHGTMAFGTLRVWLGTLELVEKRCGAAPDVPAHYGPEELRRLLRVPRRAPVTAGLQQLEDHGLLAWSPQAIQFLPQAQALREA